MVSVLWGIVAVKQALPLEMAQQCVVPLLAAAIVREIKWFEKKEDGERKEAERKREGQKRG